MSRNHSGAFLPGNRLEFGQASMGGRSGSAPAWERSVIFQVRVRHDNPPLRHSTVWIINSWQRAGGFEIVPHQYVAPVRYLKQMPAVRRGGSDSGERSENSGIVARQLMLSHLRSRRLRARGGPKMTASVNDELLVPVVQRGSCVVSRRCAPPALRLAGTAGNLK